MHNALSTSRKPQRITNQSMKFALGCVLLWKCLIRLCCSGDCFTGFIDHSGSVVIDGPSSKKMKPIRSLVFLKILFSRWCFICAALYIQSAFWSRRYSPFSHCVSHFSIPSAYEQSALAEHPPWTPVSLQTSFQSQLQYVSQVV